MKKNNYLKVRKFLITRNIKRFKQEYNWDYSFFTNPYRKTKTVFNLELSSLLLFLLNRTNISANQVTLCGVLWVYLGTFMFFLNTTTTIYMGLFIFFTKLIPDYIDGSLAHLKNQQSKEGYEIDLWSGEVSKIALLTGILIFIFNTTLDQKYLIILITLIILNFIDPRLHLSKTKFGISIYNKKLLAHIQKRKNQQGFIIKILKFLNFNSRSYYTDFLILMVILKINYGFDLILRILPWVWFVLSFFVIIRAIYQVFFKR